MRTRLFSRKALSLLLVCSMLFLFCSCSSFSKKDVMAAANEVAGNIENFNAEKLIEMSTLNKNGDRADELRKGLGGEYLDENTLKFCTAIRNTISYKILEDTFSAKGNEASVDIEFSLADYNSLLKKDFNDIDELVSAVKKSGDTVTVTYNAKFVKVDGQWLLDNLMSSGFREIFAFMDADIGILAVDLAKIVNTAACNWSGASDGVYNNTRKLSLTVEFLSDVTKLKGKGVKMTYTVSKNGKDVWKSEPVELGTKTKLQLDYGPDQDANVEMSSNYIAPGSYKFTLAADNGTVLYTSTVTTKVTIKETTVTTGTSAKGYIFYEYDFSRRVKLAEWVPVDDKRVNAVSYGSDATRIQFQMKMDPSTTGSLYFAFFYASSYADALKIKVKTDKPSVSGVAKPIVNDQGTFFALGLKTTKSFSPGIYILAMFSEDKSTLYGIAECQILSNPASYYKGQT